MQAPRSNDGGGVRLELQDLSKRYREIVALDRVSLTLEPGEIHGFVGPNGAGKTTAMRIAIGVLEPDSGQVLWNGAVPGTGQRRRIGYMPEERGLYPKMKVSDQLGYLAELHGRSPEEARQGTARWLERMGISERAADPVETLSLGNQQRVQLAASLIFDPDVLILDEPFSGLDPIGVDVLSEVLREVCAERGVPVIFSSHQLELVERLCERVTIIKSGGVVASGMVEELRRSRSEDLWQMDLDGGGDLAEADLPALVERHSPGTYRVAAGGDPQALLDRARRAGPVRSFGPVRPSLAELFRESVAPADEGPS